MWVVTRETQERGYRYFSSLSLFRPCVDHYARLAFPLGLNGEAVIGTNLPDAEQVLGLHKAFESFTYSTA